MTERDTPDPLDAQVRDAYRAPVAGDDDARRRTLRRLRAAERPRGFARVFAHLFAHPTRLAAAATLAVAVIALAWFGVRARPRPDAPPPVAGVTADTEPVTFAFRASGATRVSVVGDFNGWDPAATPLERQATSDVWTAHVPVPAGLHTYAFVVDGGDWQPDPAAPLAPVSPFGAKSSMFVVGEEGAL